MIDLFDDDNLFPFLIAVVIVLALFVVGRTCYAWMRRHPQMTMARRIQMSERERREVQELERLWNLEARNGVER